MLVTPGEGSGTPTEPHHTPSPEVQQSLPNDSPSPSQPTETTETIPTSTPTEIPTLRQYSRRARIAQSTALPTAPDEPASPLEDDSQGEAFPTISGLEVGQDRENIIKTSALPHDSTKKVTSLATNEETLPTAPDEPASPLEDESQGEAFPTISGLEAGQDRENIIKTSALPHDSTKKVTSLATDEGSMQQQLHELTYLCTCLQRQQTEMVIKIAAQDLEISSLKEWIKLLEDKDKGTAEQSGDDASIKGRSLETGEKAGVERSTEKGSNDTEELVNVLTSLDATNILTSGVQLVSVPLAVEVFTISIPTGSSLVPTASPIFTTASVVTPYSRQKGKEKMVESDTPKKKKLQEQIDIARDAEIARIHAEEELQMLIDGFDKNNDVIAKHLHEYKQAAAELTIGEKIELINKLVKYQDHHVKILKYQAQQSKPLSKNQQREFYIEDLNQMWSLVKETLSIRQAISDKEKKLWFKLKRLFEPDHEDQL
nr:hypothetical protein [Tanacetum cinerariifolium]